LSVSSSEAVRSPPFLSSLSSTDLLLVSRLVDSLSGNNASDILNATGRKNKPAGGSNGANSKNNAEAMKQLAAQLASAEGQKVEIAVKGSEVLSDEQLAERALLFPFPPFLFHQD
jgi:hypothetical protein